MSHSHAPASTTSSRVMGMSILLTLAFVVGEAFAGFQAHSLALLSDAGHNFADALALVLSWYALWIAQKPADSSRTYGYHRVGILAALVNAVSLVVIALLIFWEAFQRLRAPEPVHSGLMIGVALIAIVLNGLISFWLHAGSKNDLNVKSAYLHMLGDAVSAAGVVVAGLVVARTGASIADPLVSLLIGALILWSSWGILKETVDVLLEAAPAGLDMKVVEGAITAVPGVMNVHDLHVWTVASGIVACSCHILVGEQSVRSGQQVLKGVVEVLEHRFRIGHTTVQVEVEGCEPHDIHCTMQPLEDAHAGHDHEDE